MFDLTLSTYVILKLVTEIYILSLSKKFAVVVQKKCVGKDGYLVLIKNFILKYLSACNLSLLVGRKFSLVREFF